MPHTLPPRQGALPPSLSRPPRCQNHPPAEPRGRAGVPPPAPRPSLPARAPPRGGIGGCAPALAPVNSHHHRHRHKKKTLLFLSSKEKGERGGAGGGGGDGGGARGRAGGAGEGGAAAGAGAGRGGGGGGAAGGAVRGLRPPRVQPRCVPAVHRGRGGGVGGSGVRRAGAGGREGAGAWEGGGAAPARGGRCAGMPVRAHAPAGAFEFDRDWARAGSPRRV